MHDQLAIKVCFYLHLVDEVRWLLIFVQFEMLYSTFWYTLSTRGEEELHKEHGHMSLIQLYSLHIFLFLLNFCFQLSCTLCIFLTTKVQREKKKMKRT